MNAEAFQKNSAEMKSVAKALQFSALRHCDQRRKNIEQAPYINHPISVMNILTNEADICDVNIICAALLHDVLEDTETCFEELAHEFGQEIAAIVAELTDDKTLERSVRKHNQIANAAHKSHPAKCVKIADKIANLRDLCQSPPRDWNNQRKLEYCLWAKQVVDQMRGVNEQLESIFDQIFSDAVRNFDAENTLAPVEL